LTEPVWPECQTGQACSKSGCMTVPKQFGTPMAPKIHKNMHFATQRRNKNLERGSPSSTSFTNGKKSLISMPYLHILHSCTCCAQSSTKCKSWIPPGNYQCCTDKQESPDDARKNAPQHIQFLLQYRPSRSSKVDDFHLIWKGICHFLLTININPFQDMASFPFITAHFSYPLHSTKNLKMFPLPNFVCRQPRPRANYSCWKFSHMNQCLATIHPLHTDDRRQTDDNHNIDTYSITVVRQ